MENNGLDRKNFLNLLVQAMMRTLTKEPEELEKVYEGYKSLIENQIKKDPQQEEACKESMQIVEKAYAIFSDPEMIDIIVRNGVTAKQFISRYGERILGDNKRKYDMSDRLNPSLIAYQNSDCMTRKLKYVPKQGIEHSYMNAEGKEITIQEIGRLVYEEWNGVVSNLSKYRVTREVGKDLLQVDEIFSNIIIFDMGKPEYREAVLEELLSKNNIHLSNAGGYIGDIEEARINETDFKEGTETVVAGDYSYRTGPKYMLTYHSEKIAAAKLLEESQKSKTKKTGPIIDIMSALRGGREGGTTAERRKVDGAER